MQNQRAGWDPQSPNSAPAQMKSLLFCLGNLSSNLLFIVAFLFSITSYSKSNNLFNHYTIGFIGIAF